MRYSILAAITITGYVLLGTGCSGGSADNTNASTNPAIPDSGFVSVSLTDGPWEDASALMMAIAGVEFGNANGQVMHFELAGGPMSIDMMQLQNGAFESLLLDAEVPVGQYDWMRLNIDLNGSYLELAGTGGQHTMQMGPNASNGLEVHESFEIVPSVHYEFMLDFDLRRGLQYNDMGMMGEQYELHSAMRLIDISQAGGLTGMVDPSLIDVNHADCDPAPGGNWAYLFPGSASGPDDFAETEVDGIPGPIAVNRIEINTATGNHHFDFAYLEAGSYRVALSCSGEWDEAGDDDFPTDPEGRFDFQLFSMPMDVVAGEIHSLGMTL